MDYIVAILSVTTGVSYLFFLSSAVRNSPKYFFVVGLLALNTAVAFGVDFILFDKKTMNIIGLLVFTAVFLVTFSERGRIIKLNQRANS